MKKFTINLNNVQRVKNFVTDTEQLSSDIDIRLGRYTIDARSIMGIFSLDLSKDLVVELISDDEEEIALFSELMKKYKVEE